jgi:hypothetical protein
MLIKFLKHGKGNGAGPIDYLCSPEDREVAPEVLSGDAEATRELIDNLDFKYRYTSGVLAFHDEDDPSLEQLREAMDFFEENAFPGLDPDQYNILWVCHRDKGKTELHFIVPRVELSTGKSLNIQPPGYQKRYDEIRNYLNAKHGWVSPDDRRQSLSLPDQICKDKAKLKRTWGGGGTR